MNTDDSNSIKVAKHGFAYYSIIGGSLLLVSTITFLFWHIYIAADQIENRERDIQMIDRERSVLQSTNTRDIEGAPKIKLGNNESMTININHAAAPSAANRVVEL